MTPGPRFGNVPMCELSPCLGGMCWKRWQSSWETFPSYSHRSEVVRGLQRATSNMQGEFRSMYVLPEKVATTLGSRAGGAIRTTTYA